MVGQTHHENNVDPVYPMEVMMPDQVTKLTITRDMAIMAMKHVDEGTFPPPDAPREDAMAVQYLLRKEGEKIRAEKAELARRRRDADASSARRAAHSFTQSTEVTQGARRNRARVPQMTEAERARLTRNLDSSFASEDENGIPIPKTPGAALMGLNTYLRLTQPPGEGERALLHKQQISNCRALENILEKLGPINLTEENQGRHVSEPATAARPHRQPLVGEDLRNVITQRTVDRARAHRASDSANQDDRDFEPCGAACFSFNIRDTRMPKGFKLATGTPKYDGTQDPRLWLEDYLIACTCQGGTSTTAMQYIQLMLADSARGWLTSQPKNSFNTWEEFRDSFIRSFEGTYARPTTYVELTRCKQEKSESLRAYIQRWTLLRNTMEAVSEDRVMDAFMHGVSRRDLREEFGRLQPKTMADLMKTANQWAEGEDYVLENSPKSEPWPSNWRESNRKKKPRFN
jgi:hypothetical protein